MEASLKFKQLQPPPSKHMPHSPFPIQIPNPGQLSPLLSKQFYFNYANYSQDLLSQIYLNNDSRSQYSPFGLKNGGLQAMHRPANDSGDSKYSRPPDHPSRPIQTNANSSLQRTLENGSQHKPQELTTYSCGICERADFPSESEVITHRKVSHNIKTGVSLRCAYCNGDFRSR